MKVKSNVVNLYLVMNSSYEIVFVQGGTPLESTSTQVVVNLLALTRCRRYYEVEPKDQSFIDINRSSVKIYVPIFVIMHSRLHGAPQTMYLQVDSKRSTHGFTTSTVGLVY